MKIAVITAMHDEYRAVSACFGSAGATVAGALRAARFHTKEHEFHVVESGMGSGNAARAAEMLVRDRHPDLLISTGFCGGIESGLQTGDVVVAKKIIIADEGGFMEIPVLLHAVGQTFVACQEASGNRTVEGVFVCAADITSKVRFAGVLSGRYPNPVVEMESGAIAIIAAEHNIPMLAIRAVSDTAAEEPGFSLDEFCDPDMRRIHPCKVLLTVLRKPRIIPQLVRLSRSSRRAAESLTAALPGLFSTI